MARRRRRDWELEQLARSVRSKSWTPKEVARPGRGALGRAKAAGVKNPASAAAAVKKAKPTVKPKAPTPRKPASASTGSMGQTAKPPPKTDPPKPKKIDTSNVTIQGYYPGGGVISGKKFGTGKGSPQTKPAGKPKDVTGALGGALGIPGLLTDEQLRKQAMALIEPIFAAQREALQGAYNSRSAAVRNAYAALAEISKSIAPQVQGAFQTAADSQAAYGKGFSSQATKESAAQAAAANAPLEAQGSPQRVESLMEGGGGDALYATGGYIPATSFAKQGAAWTSAASQFPQTAAQAGVQEQQRIGNMFTQAVKELEAGRPEALLNAITSLRENNWRLVDYRQKEDERRWQHQQYEAEMKATAKANAAKLDLETRQWLAEMELNWAKLNAQQRRDALAAKKYTDGLQIDLASLDLRQKKYLLDVAKYETSKNKAAQSKKKRSQFTRKQLSDMQATAATIAEGVYNGGVDPDTNEQLPQLNWADALYEMLKAGIPEWMAVNYLSKWYKPGERGRPVNYKVPPRPKTVRGGD